MTARLWQVALGGPLDDLGLEVEAPTAQDAAEIAAEMLTNPRVRDQIGEIALVSSEERISGPTLRDLAHGRKSRLRRRI